MTANNYSFNPECIKQNLVKLALIYGENGTGKTNLGWALFDIVSHLTDNNSHIETNNYLNAFSKEKYAEFKFEFRFSDRYQKIKTLIYEYQKNENSVLISEKIIINNNVVLNYNLNQPLITTLSGAENLNKNINPSQNLSAVKYIYNNTSLDKRNQDNVIFIKFIEFINHILYFRSVFEGKVFSGYKTGLSNIEQDIIKNKNLKNFEQFLSDFGLNFQLVSVKQLNKQTIGVKMGTQVLPFFEIISTGTLSLTYFYYWWQSIKDNQIPWGCPKKYAACFFSNLN